ncbi:MAG: fibronectin type III domain-containing protein, partial [Pseudomonadota bacterium]|nr:fibronectin type III domain-containing protein [Pseudomonadota bacterium]
GGVSGNDSNSASISFRTPASYWRNGDNTLLFRHTRTQGYIIDSATVSFESAPGGNTTSPAFPVDLRGSTPEEAAITINVSKPASASEAIITLSTYDADFADEGELVINGNTPVKLFGSGGVSGNDSNSASISFRTPASYWRNGDNTLLFRHTRTQGYIIDAATVSFESSQGGGNTGSASLSWTPPVARTDGNALALSEIAGYTAYYGTSAGNYPNSLNINDGSATSATITNLPLDTYYMVVTTRDSDGRESSYSSEVVKVVN